MIGQALTGDRPAARYLVGTDARIAGLVARLSPLLVRRLVAARSVPAADLQAQYL